MERSDWLAIQNEARNHPPQTHQQKTDSAIVQLRAELLEQVHQLRQGLSERLRTKEQP